MKPTLNGEFLLFVGNNDKLKSIARNVIEHSVNAINLTKINGQFLHETTDQRTLFSLIIQEMERNVLMIEEMSHDSQNIIRSIIGVNLPAPDGQIEYMKHLIQDLKSKR